MKTATDPRHQKRITRMKTLFATSFKSGQPTKADIIIAQYAPEWPIASMNKVDLAILRTAVLELMQNTTPVNVVMDESIEIAKEFGTDISPKFINGVLANIIQKGASLWNKKTS